MLHLAFREEEVELILDHPHPAIRRPRQWLVIAATSWPGQRARALLKQAATDKRDWVATAAHQALTGHYPKRFDIL